ncbi:MAG: hypothetical protein Q8R96_23255 [Bacteroidota bacterium]|nr:hypothetical protein [Bacteroidota bacterium]
MKLLIFILLICLMTNCTNTAQKHSSNLKAKTATATLSQSDSLNLDLQIKIFDSIYNCVEKELYDSVKRYQIDGIDFSDISEGIERKYVECKNNLTKTFIGYKLAQNYYIHFNSSKKMIYQQKAEPLFYSFLSFNEGEVASMYLKLDIKKVHFITKEWNNFSEQDKNAILFYGLLRGFDNGLPDILKSVE